MVVYNGAKFMALPLGIHELTFDLLRSKESGQREQEAALGDPGWVTQWLALGRGCVFVGEQVMHTVLRLSPIECDLG